MQPIPSLWPLLRRRHRPLPDRGALLQQRLLGGPQLRPLRRRPQLQVEAVPVGAHLLQPP